MSKKCKTCSTRIDNRFIYCEPCRLKARLKSKAKSIERQKEKRKNKPFILDLKRRATEQQPPHKCATIGCDEMVTGERVYCPTCRVLRKRQHAKKQRDTGYVRDRSQIPQTGMQWLYDINADLAQAGKQSYGQWRAGKNANSSTTVHL